jgi:hypothetical protein
MVTTAGVSGEQEFEPALAFRNIPKSLLDLSSSLKVILTDDREKIEYNYEVFLSKTYKVKDGRIKFGSKWLTTHGLYIMVGHRILIVNAELATNTELD